MSRERRWTMESVSLDELKSGTLAQTRKAAEEVALDRYRQTRRHLGKVVMSEVCDSKRVVNVIIREWRD